MNIELQQIGLAAAALAVALIVALVTTPVVMNLAHRVGAMDIPKDNRRMHDPPIPRMGGLAIALGFLLSALLFVPITEQMRGMLLGSIIILVLGIFDDIYSLKAWFKFIVQIVAAVVAVATGSIIDCVSNPNIFSANLYWELGWLSSPVTVLWIVAITNAVNLIDGLDGLAGSVTLPVAIFFSLLAAWWDKGSVGAFAAALAGGILGFLIYNFYPAKVFMGDTGSLFLGGAVCGMAFAVDAPLILIPVGIIYIAETMSDIIQVTYFKLTHGKRIFRMAPLHHHLELGGWSEVRIVLTFTAITVAFCLLAFAGVMYRYGV